MTPAGAEVVPVLTDAEADFLCACIDAGADDNRGRMVDVSGRRNEPRADRLIALGLLWDTAPYLVDVTHLGRVALDRHTAEHPGWRPTRPTACPAGTPVTLDGPRVLTPRPTPSPTGKVHYVVHEFVAGALDAQVRVACGRTGSVVHRWGARAWDSIVWRGDACRRCVDVVDSQEDTGTVYVPPRR